MARSLATVWLILGLPVYGHVQGQQLEAPAGELVDLVFTVEHGCASSPTVAVAMEVPDGVTEVSAIAPDGWTVAVEGDVVRWTGGSLPADTAGDFAFTARMPQAPGSTIHFPFVQTCVEGELAWIEIPTAAGGEPRFPAPAVEIVAGSAATSLPPTTTTTTPTTPSVPVAPTSSVPTSTTEPIPSGQGDPGSGAGLLWLVGLGTMAAVAAGVATSRARR